jgi:hypothetical protein
MIDGVPVKVPNIYPCDQEIPCFHGTQQFLYMFTK